MLISGLGWVLIIVRPCCDPGQLVLLGRRIIVGGQALSGYLIHLIIQTGQQLPVQILQARIV